MEALYRDDNMSFPMSPYSVRITITKGDKRAVILEAMADKFRRGTADEGEARQMLQEYLDLAATVPSEIEGLPFRTYGYALVLHETKGIIVSSIIPGRPRTRSTPVIHRYRLSCLRSL